MDVDKILTEAAKTYKERHKSYGDNYKHYGAAMMGIFPGGLKIDTAEEFVKLGLLHNIVTKITRYAQNIKRGGHKDSAHDAMVYCAMLEEMTDE